MTPSTVASTSLLEKLEALRAELADLAFHLEQRGRLDAADLAIAIAGRLTELRQNGQNIESISEARF